MTTRVEAVGIDEWITTTFPYDTEIGTATIDSVAISVSVIDGVDATPANLIAGAPQIAGTEVRQLIRTPLANVKYKVHCLANLSDGQKLARDYFLAGAPI